MERCVRANLNGRLVVALRFRCVLDHPIKPGVRVTPSRDGPRLPSLCSPFVGFRSPPTGADDGNELQLGRRVGVGRAGEQLPRQLRHRRKEPR